MSDRVSSVLDRLDPVFEWSIFGPIRQDEVRSRLSAFILLGRYALMTNLLISRVLAPIKTRRFVWKSFESNDLCFLLSNLRSCLRCCRRSSTYKSSLSASFSDYSPSFFLMEFMLLITSESFDVSDIMFTIGLMLTLDLYDSPISLLTLSRRTDSVSLDVQQLIPIAVLVNTYVELIFKL